MNATKSVTESPSKLLWLGALAILLAGAALLMTADEAEATHFRAGTLQWNGTPDATQGLTPADEHVVFLGGRLAFNAAYLHGQCNVYQPGTRIPWNPVLWGNLWTGDGGTTAYDMIVQNLDTQRCRYIGKMVAPAFPVDRTGLPGLPAPLDDVPYGDIPHVYSGPKDLSGRPWEVVHEICCRISPSDGHINNPDKYPQLITYIDLSIPNNSPVVYLQPLRFCPIDDICNFRIYATDADQNTLRFRLSKPQESTYGGGFGTFAQPGPYATCSLCPSGMRYATIDEDTGWVTWDTTNAVRFKPTPPLRNLYSMGVMVEDNFATVPLDFMIELVDVSELITCPDGIQPKVDPDTGEPYCPTGDCSDPDKKDLPECNPPPPPPPEPTLPRESPEDPNEWYIPEPPANAPYQEPAVANAQAIDYAYQDYIDWEIAGKDTDGDGLADRDDLCPNDATSGLDDLDNDGIGNGCDADMDGDGLLNDADPCPSSAANDCNLISKEESKVETQRNAARGQLQTDDGQEVQAGSGSVAVHQEPAKKSPTGFVVLGIVGAALVVLLLAIVAVRRRK